MCLVNMGGSILEALELALLGMAGSHNEGSDARREGSYSDDCCGIFFFLCFLASLGADSTFTLGMEVRRAGTVRGGDLCREVHVKI